jgi:hypothetical protein
MGLPMRPNRLPPILIPLFVACLVSCVERPWEVRTYPLGQKIKIGNLTYLGIETQWSSAFGEGPGARAPQNQFLLVRLSVSNAGNSDAPVPNFSVEDSTGHRFAELSDGNGVQDWIGALRMLSPNDTLVGNAAFDVPTGHYTLHILDEDGEHEARIDLPLNFQNQSGDPSGMDLLKPGPASIKR